MWQDIRYTLRMLSRNPVFTIVAVLTLALGIGSTTAIFSVVYGVLLGPLPYPKPEQIVELREMNDKGGLMSFADPNFEDLRSQNHCLQGMAEYAAWPRPITVGSEPTRTMVASVSRDFFSVMGVQPVIGRGFSAEDQRRGAAPVAVVSYAYWKQYLGSTTDVSAIKLKIDNQMFSLVGVLPHGFRFPFHSDVWIPRELAERLPSRSAHNWHVVARLADTVSLAQARAELSRIAQGLKQQYGQDTMMRNVSVFTLRNALTNQVRPALLLLLGAVIFLLLVACANVVNLLLAQAKAREKELAIRSAIGAGRNRLLQQFLTEIFVLALTGGTLGVFAAFWELDVLLAIAPKNLPRLEDVSINLPVLLFAFTMSVVVAVAMGIFVALRATCRDVQGALVERGQGHIGTLRGNRYVNYRQRPQATGHFAAVLRTDQELPTVIPAAREIIRSLNPDIPHSFGTFGQVVNASLEPRRFNLTIVGALASTALLLAVTGIYGLMAYSVARRKQELGVRLAVGADPADILRLVLGQGAVTVGVGVVIGACGSVAVTRTMQSLLFGVTATDPATFVSGAILLTLAALLGCYFPARRATKVDPIVALRYE